MGGEVAGFVVVEASLGIAFLADETIVAAGCCTTVFGAELAVGEILHLAEERARAVCHRGGGAKVVEVVVENILWREVVEIDGGRRVEVGKERGFGACAPIKE